MVSRSGSAAGAMLAAACVMLPGCSTTGQPVTQTVQVETPGCEAVACELSNDRGRWRVPRTPGSVTLTTSHEPLTVQCRADGGALSSRQSASTMAPTTGAGGVAGGVAGGAAVGAAVGSLALSFIPVLGVIVVMSGVAAGAAAGQAVEAHQRAMHYPDLVSVPMHCPSPALTAPAGAPLGLGIRGLPAAQAQAAGAGARAAVLVTSVRAGGAAAAAGLREGDIVLAAGGHELADAADFEDRLRALASGTPLPLRVLREGRELTLVLMRDGASP